MATYYTTVAGSIIDDGSRANPFDHASFRLWCQNTALPGDICYVEGGAYTPAANISSARNGTIAAPITIIGVVNLASLAEADDEADMPFFDGGANAYGFTTSGDYWNIRNLKVRCTYNAGYGIWADTGSTVQNCVVENLGTGYAIYAGGLYTNIIDCKASSPAGAAAIYTNQNTRILGNYIHDSLVGIRVSIFRAVIVGNVFDTCVVAINLNDQDYAVIVGNTAYGGTTGITTPASQVCLIHGNLFSEFTTYGANWTGGAQLSNWFDYNVWHDAALNNVTAGPHSSTDDPLFVDPTLGTPEGFRVRLEAYRNLGHTLSVLGGVSPSVYDTGPSLGSVGAGYDFSGDHELLDGLETVTLDGADLTNVYRHREQIVEQDSSSGVYQSRNVRFDLPPGDAYYAAMDKPTIGGIIVDGDGTSYVIQSVSPPSQFTDYYGCDCRALVLDGTYDLDDTITLWPMVDSLSAMGSRLTTYPTANADFTDVPAKVMLRPSQAETEFAQRDFVEQYDVYVNTDIGQVRNGDLLRDQDGHWYTIVSYRNREELSELSVMLCEDRIGGP